MLVSRVYETRINQCGLFAMLRMYAAVRRKRAPDLRIAAEGLAILRQSRFTKVVFTLSSCEYCVIPFASLPRNRAVTEQGSAQENLCTCRQICVRSSGIGFL